jgi:hypothetical protein
MKIWLNELERRKGWFVCNRSSCLCYNAVPGRVFTILSAVIEQSHCPFRESFFTLPPIETEAS